MDQSEDVLETLKAIRRELATIRQQNTEFIQFMRSAEQEVPEWYRRFTNAMHDVHDIKYMYEDCGHAVPQHVLRECERLDDRFRQLLDKMNEEGGAFNKIRREMAADPLNRWDHTRLLEQRKENGSETG